MRSDFQPSINPAYLEDASGFQGYAERAYAPEDEAQLSAILRDLSISEIPVTIAGAGTGVTGGRVPLGGAVISLEKFNRLETGRGSAAAGAGVLLRDVHAAAAATGQFYAPDPTETAASIGGTIATNASGSRSFRYGATRDHVLGLRVALMDGTILEVGRGDRPYFAVPALPLPFTTKHSAGFRLHPEADWIDLFTGSEGTLGIIVKAELRLLPAPKALLAGVVFFPEDGTCIAAVDRWRAFPGLRMLEYFDRDSLALLGTRFSGTPAAGAALLFEQEIASEDDAEIDLWEERLQEAGALLEQSWFASGTADRERFRRFRHALPELVNDAVRRNGYMKLGSDYAVPLECNGEMLAFYRAHLDEVFPGRSVVFGHIGDAHVHVNLLPSSDEEFARGKDLMLEFARKAVSLGGTVSAEHGLGKRKAHLLALQYKPEEIEAMKEVKRRLDPKWLLGRGNLFE